MGKIKVYELAKELNVSNADLIKKLNELGINANSHLSALTDEECNKIKDSMNKNSNQVKNQNNNNAAPHIIRRQVTVINTNSEKTAVDKITTDISGKVQKTHKILENEKKPEQNNNDKNNSFNNRNNNDRNNNDRNNNDRNNRGTQNFNNRTPRFFNNSNVVVTRNGKPVEQAQNKENNMENTNKVAETSNDQRPHPYNNDNRRNFDNRNNNQSNSNYQNRSGNYNNYRNNNNNGYNNGNSGYHNVNSNNGYHSGNNTGYNNYNRNNNGYNNYQKKDENGNIINNTQGYRPMNQRNNNYNRNNNNVDNTSYQVNRFIKKASVEAPIEQKDVRDYSTTLIDKKKYNADYSSTDNRKNKINKNELREQHSRISNLKLDGLEVDKLGNGLLDLYERDSDLIRKKIAKKKKEKNVIKQTKIIPMTEVELPEVMTVKEFANDIKKQASDVIKKLFSLGIMATVNQEIDFDTAYLIANEYKIAAKKQVLVTYEDKLFDDTEDIEKDLKPRPPIVVVMGHVDHGKTSLLDKIRSTNVVSKEAGGITQKIGAYKVKIKDREICFLDTPGHEAFTQMRARGAQITDVAILVVAADDGVKPQTIEAIDHAKAAGVSIIVAINKIDKPGADPDKVKQELLEHGLVAEEWGGDTICVPISAKTGEGIDNLLEMVLLVADMKNLRANPNKQAKGTVLEARLDKNIGTVASVIVQRGMLNVGDTIVVGDIIGKVRAMIDDKGKRVKKAGPSTPVEIIGLSEVPQMGDIFYEVSDEKTAKHLVAQRRANERVNLIKHSSKITLDDLFNKIKQGEIKDLNIIIKADVLGSVEALSDSLKKLSNDEVRINIIHASTGGINESDVTLAAVSNAIIIGFNVRPDAIAKKQADKEKVDLRLYNIIYDAINDVEAAMKGMLAPTYKEVILGMCEVRQLFKVSSLGTIAGCFVKQGKIVRNASARVIRDSVVIAEDKIDSLKRGKDDAKEVAENYECGIKLEKFNDIKENDIIECFEMQEEKKV